jgi:hypothetical protein
MQIKYHEIKSCCDYLRFAVMEIPYRYCGRHWEVAKQALAEGHSCCSKTVIKHRLIAIIEFLPILNIIAAIFDHRINGKTAEIKPKKLSVKPKQSEVDNLPGVLKWADTENVMPVILSPEGSIPNKIQTCFGNTYFAVKQTFPTEIPKETVVILEVDEDWSNQENHPTKSIWEAMALEKQKVRETFIKTYNEDKIGSIPSKNAPLVITIAPKDETPSLLLKRYERILNYIVSSNVPKQVIFSGLSCSDAKLGMKIAIGGIRKFCCSHIGKIDRIDYVIRDLWQEWTECLTMPALNHPSL